MTLPVVYFAIVNGEFLKVGYATDVEQRFKEHAASKLGVRVSFEPLCVVRGTMADEKSIQRHFKAFALPGETEVFRPDETVLSYVRWLRDQYYVWVPDDEDCLPISEQPIVDAAVWNPTSERRKDRPSGLFLFPDKFGPFCIPPRDTTPDDFYTNKVIIDAAREAMGDIDLDPSSHAIANRVVQAERFFAIHDNGLEQEWAGKVWLNPPFSQWKSWVPKILWEWESGRIETMCVLSATRTITAQYFEPIHKRSEAMCVLHGRIPFWGGKATGSPDDGHVVFYFGPELGRFDAAFSSLGTVWRHKQ